MCNVKSFPAHAATAVDRGRPTILTRTFTGLMRRYSHLSSAAHVRRAPARGRSCDVVRWGFAIASSPHVSRHSPAPRRCWHADPCATSNPHRCYTLLLSRLPHRRASPLARPVSHLTPKITLASILGIAAGRSPHGAPPTPTSIPSSASSAIRSFSSHMSPPRTARRHAQDGEHLPPSCPQARGKGH